MPNFAGLAAGLILMGVIIGVILTSILWALWHFVLSHISIGWAL